LCIRSFRLLFEPSRRQRGSEQHCSHAAPTRQSTLPSPAGPTKGCHTRVFTWLICESYDDKGNAIVYKYAEENDDNLDRTQSNERNRVRTANRYLKHIKYSNRTPNRDAATWKATDPAQLPSETWMFDVVFDYGEGHYTEDAPDAQGRIFARAQIDHPAESHWPVRQDRFSSYLAGFEVRTYRLCRRVLMFHHFPQELGINDCLVRSSEFSYSESPSCLSSPVLRNQATCASRTKITPIGI
jgi:Salmonella virulence plasmid 65kDa B protein